MMPRTTRAAVFALVSLAGVTASAPGQEASAVAEGLARKLGVADLRADVVDALIQMRGDAVRPVVAVLSRQPARLSPSTAGAALAVLEGLGPEAVGAVPELVRLRAVASPTWRARLDEALAYLWPWEPDFWNEPKDFMAEYTKAYDWTLEHRAHRREILSAIYRLHRIREQGVDPRDLDALVPFTVDADPVLRDMACENVRRFDSEARRVAPFLAEAIRFPFPLAPRPRHGQELRDVVDLVLDLAGNDPVSLQAHAYLMIYGEDVETRVRGAQGIARHSEDAIPYYRYMQRVVQREQSQEVRVAVVRAIAALPAGTEADVMLQHLTGSSDAEVRAIARTAMEQRRLERPGVVPGGR